MCQLWHNLFENSKKKKILKRVGVDDTYLPSPEINKEFKNLSSPALNVVTQSPGITVSVLLM